MSVHQVGVPVDREAKGCYGVSAGVYLAGN